MKRSRAGRTIACDATTIDEPTMGKHDTHRTRRGHGSVSFLKSASSRCAKAAPVHVRNLRLSIAFLAPGALLRQNLVNQLDADGTLADGRGNALGASRAHVSDGEHTGPVRLEEEGWTAQRPL
jgi:hypothetical protein